jgi:hypothetical protein
MKASMQILAGAAAVALCACSQKDAAKTDTSKVAQEGAPAAKVAATATPGSFDPATRTLTIHAVDFAYGMPDSISAGWTNIHLANDGNTLHHVQIVKLDSGKTVADVKAGMSQPMTGPAPAWMHDIGGPNAPDPHGTSDATVNLEPGNYVVLCFVDLGDHIPHVAKGMIHALTVVPNTASMGTEPKSDITISLADYAFSVTGALSAGKHVVKVVNNGPQPHEVELVKFADGKGMKDLAAWVAKADGPPPASALGGASGIAKGGTNYTSFDLTPGNYAFLCFIPDAKDGKAHLEHGMVKEFKVN